MAAEKKSQSPEILLDENLTLCQIAKDNNLPLDEFINQLPWDQKVQDEFSKRSKKIGEFSHFADTNTHTKITYHGIFPIIALIEEIRRNAQEIDDKEKEANKNNYNKKNEDALDINLLTESFTKEIFESNDLTSKQKKDYLKGILNVMDYPSKENFKAFEKTTHQLYGERSITRTLAGIGLILAGAVLVAAGVTLAVTGKVFTFFTMGAGFPVGLATIALGTCGAVVGAGLFGAGIYNFKKGVTKSVDNCDSESNARQFYDKVEEHSRPHLTNH